MNRNLLLLALCQGLFLTNNVVFIAINGLVGLSLAPEGWLATLPITGYVVGWRIRGSALDTLAAYGLTFAFAFAMIWIGVLLGSVVKTPEGVTGIAFAALFPITFVASTFVPLNSMPSLLQTVAAWNPTTTLSDGLRRLFGNPTSVAQPEDPWPMHHPVAYTWIWVALIVFVCAPLAVRAYQRSIEA